MLNAYIIMIVVMVIKVSGNTQTPWLVVIACIILVWFAGLLISGRLKIKFTKEYKED